MKNLLSVLSVVLLISACSGSSQNLTEQEAERLIREANNYPKQVSVSTGSIKTSSPYGKELKRLVHEGKFRCNGWITCEATDDIKHLFKKGNLRYYHDRGTISAEPYFLQKDIASIDEILIDSSNGTAVVKYTLGAKTSDYYDQLHAANPTYYESLIAGILKKLNSTSQEKIILKKWDQGWRVLGG